MNDKSLQLSVQMGSDWVRHIAAKELTRRETQSYLSDIPVQQEWDQRANEDNVPYVDPPPFAEIQPAVTSNPADAGFFLSENGESGDFSALTRNPSKPLFGDRNAAEPSDIAAYKSGDVLGDGNSISQSGSDAVSGIAELEVKNGAAEAGSHSAEAESSDINHASSGAVSNGVDVAVPNKDSPPDGFYGDRNCDSIHDSEPGYIKDYAAGWEPNGAAVQAGDGWIRLANRHDVDPNALALANARNGNINLQPGQYITFNGLDSVSDAGRAVVQDIWDNEASFSKATGRPASRPEFGGDLVDHIVLSPIGGLGSQLANTAGDMFNTLAISAIASIDKDNNPAQISATNYPFFGTGPVYDNQSYFGKYFRSNSTTENSTNVFEDSTQGKLSEAAAIPVAMTPIGGAVFAATGGVMVKNGLDSIDQGQTELGAGQIMQGVGAMIPGVGKVPGAVRGLAGDLRAMGVRDYTVQWKPHEPVLYSGVSPPFKLAPIPSREEIVKDLGDVVQPHLEAISQLDEDALVGFRGSLARGFKGPHKGNAPFDPQSFDVDAFIVSDELAAQVKSRNNFRNGGRIPEIYEIQNSIDRSLRQQPSFSGLRDEPFTFRIFTRDEIKKFQSGGDAQYFLIRSGQ